MPLCPRRCNYSPLYPIQEVVLRFENQEETKEHLEGLKKDNERTIERLREEKEKLQDEYEEMKYSGDAKLSRYNLALDTLQLIELHVTNLTLFWASILRATNDFGEPKAIWFTLCHIYDKFYEPTFSKDRKWLIASLLKVYGYLI